MAPARTLAAVSIFSIPLLLTHLPASAQTSAAAAESTRSIVTPLQGHPGNVFLQDEAVVIPAPTNVVVAVTSWRLLDERTNVLRRSESEDVRASLTLGKLPVGWYRLEYGSSANPCESWTTLAVLSPFLSPVPDDSPVCVDGAVAWFARNDVASQRRFANLAALAGVKWIRDRLRWADLQPKPGALVDGETTYDTAAEAQTQAGLKVLQVFHDSPEWARVAGESGGRLSRDLRNVYQLGEKLGRRFKGRVSAWEPWNEANIEMFGGHTVDQMCSWQKAAWLGFKAGDPAATVGWNVTTTLPTTAQTFGVLANETWPYYDTYNIHAYEWSHGYSEFWNSAREAAAGRAIWITEADRGTPHLKNPPWYDQDRRLERLKAEWLPQAYASSIYSGAARHFQFVLGHYHEANGVQFGLLRLDMTPRPAYVALAAVGRHLAGARPLGRWRPAPDVEVYAFRAFPDGQERDVLVAWTEREVDWDQRGSARSDWKLPSNLGAAKVFDYLGRSLGSGLPAPLISAPVYVELPPGAADKLPLNKPPPVAGEPRRIEPAAVVLQAEMACGTEQRVEDIKWSEGYAYRATPGTPLQFKLNVYNFGAAMVKGSVQVVKKPDNWSVDLESAGFETEPMGRQSLTATLKTSAETTDGWVILEANCGPGPKPRLALRAVAPKKAGVAEKK